MKRYFIPTFAFIVLCYALTVLFSNVVRQSELNNSRLPKPYLVKILDEHEVRLCSCNDTLVILLENSSVLAEEKTIFIYKPSK